MHKSIKMLTVSAMLAAFVVLLLNFSIRTAGFQFNFGDLPVYIGALLFGPLCGVSVAGVGNLIVQLELYGLSPTTPMWMIPPIVTGLIAGLFAKRYSYDLSPKQAIIILTLTNILHTFLNTVFLYADAKIYGYYYPALILGMLLPRFGLAIAKGVVYALLLPPLVKRLRRIINVAA